MQLPVELQQVSGTPAYEQAQTRDISSRGVCFYLDRTLTINSEIEFILTLPPEITLANSIRVYCKGRVVRVEPSSIPHGKVAVAATIQRYEFLAK